NRLDRWNRRLPPRRIEPNWTRVIPPLGGRGRRARKKDKHCKGGECRDPLHENQSVLDNRTILTRFYRLGAEDPRQAARSACPGRARGPRSPLFATQQGGGLGKIAPLRAPPRGGAGLGG